MNAIPSMADAPFHCPPDLWLDLPVPISVNKLRRINWRAHKRAAAWRDMADRHLLAAKVRSEHPIKLNSIKRFELVIVLDEKRVLIDLDNTLKLLVDYLHDRNIVENDSPKHMRRLVVEWGYAPEGARIFIKPRPLSVNGILHDAVETLEAAPMSRPRKADRDFSQGLETPVICERLGITRQRLKQIKDDAAGKRERAG